MLLWAFLYKVVFSDGISKNNNYKDRDTANHKDLVSSFIQRLYIDRVAPTLPLDVKEGNLVLDVCMQFYNSEVRNKFLNTWGSESGIYVIGLIDDPCVYYIGKTSNFRRRWYAHLQTKTHSKFHKLLRLAGIERFYVAILEVCPAESKFLSSRENFYLDKYKPLLNTLYSTGSTSFKKIQVNNTFSLELKALKSRGLVLRKTQRVGIVPVYVYNLVKTPQDMSIKVTYFKSVRLAAKFFGCAPFTIFSYMDTYISYKGNFYFSFAVSENRLLSNNLINKRLLSDKGVLGKYSPVKIWAYDAYTLNPIKGNPFFSKNQAAVSLGISYTLLNLWLDKERACGPGYYFFTNPLSLDKIKALLDKAKDLRIGNYRKIWVYNANNLELINNQPFAHLKDAADYFNVRPATILKHLDSKLATKRKGVLVYTFSKELDSGFKAKLLTSKTTGVALTRHFNQKVWVYEVQSVELVNNAPFSSVKKASDFLGTNPETIKIHLDTQKAVKLRKTSEMFYYFSYELGTELRAKLLSSGKPNMAGSLGRKSLWVYSADTLELINNEPFSSRSLACAYLKTNRATIQNNLDTRKSVRLINYPTSVYFFSCELDSKSKSEL